MNAEFKGNLRRWVVSIPKILVVSFVLTFLLTLPFLRGWRGMYAGLVFSTCCALFGSFLVDVGAEWVLKRFFPFNVVLSALALVAAGTAGCATGFVWLILTGFSTIPRGYQDFRVTLYVCLGNTIVFSSALYLINSTRLRLERANRDLRESEIAAARAGQLATEAQLESLAARLQPHFLFNTLNSISALVHEDPDRADAMIQQLSRLLRYSLDVHNERLVPLARELSITRDYLAIEAVRFERRLKVETDVDERLLEMPIPPFSLQTLVENSVKYAIGTRSTVGSIRIAARGTGEFIELSVCDDGPGFTLDDLKRGHGLDLLRSRLMALYRERGSLSVANSDGCVVTVRIPRDGAPEFGWEARYDAVVESISR